MKRVRIGIVGSTPLVEWAILPALSGPDSSAPPDSGAWWARRPVARSEIAYQPPAQADVVAIADADRANVERIASAARVRAVYTDWRAMLREVPLDAVVCGAGAEAVGEIVDALAKSAGARQMWTLGAPAGAAAPASQVLERARNAGLTLWCARSLRLAAAHRAAHQLIERDEIGPVAALELRWASPLPLLAAAARGGDYSAQAANAYTALDLLLYFAACRPGATAHPMAVMAGEAGGAVTVWVKFGDGVGGVALFASSESWSAPLPRLEICGTQGRSIVCEAGRRMWLHKPRETARLLEPPGLALHLSSANLMGVAEDLKAFLANCVEDEPGQATVTAHGSDALRGLVLLEAVQESLASGQLVELARTPAPARVVAERPIGTTYSQTATLPLQL